MKPRPLTVLQTLAAARSEEELIESLRSLGHSTAPIAGRLAWYEGPWRDEDGLLLNPGDPAPLFLVGGTRSDQSRELERALRLAAGQSVSGLAAAFWCSGRALALCIARADGAEWCRVGPRQQDERALEALSAFCQGQPTQVALLLAFHALQRRSVGRAFFKDVRAVVREVSSSWCRGPEDPADRHALAIHLLCRLMFLYFVQARGWLDGDSGYLASVLLDPDAEDLYRQRLSPLFFSVLNQEPEQRPEVWRCPGIPYLNGGLFERTVLEQAHPALDLPDDVVRSLSLVLERYTFVETERSSGSTSLDPETLGSVFESLMAPEDRGRTGTFYTPPTLVDVVVEHTLRSRLVNELGERVLGGESAREQERPRVEQILDQLALVDPAMGSGAFLVGALHQLASLRVTALGEAGAVAIRNVVERNLYGVDVSSTAVTIAGLRLWLAIASAPGAAPEPLPNLAHRLRRGNALWGLATRCGLQGGGVSPRIARRQREAAARYSSAHGEEKAKAASALRAAEDAAAKAVLQSVQQRLEEDVAAIRARTEPDLLGHRRALSGAEQKSLVALEEQLDSVRGQVHRLRRGDGAPTFDFHAHFAPVMESGGFDVVVGNPPWVRLSNVDPGERRLLRSTYSWIADAGNGRAFGAQPDLSVAFVQRSLALLRPGGAFGLVVPGKLFTAGYASALRSGLLQQAQLLALLDLSESSLGQFGADVLPAVIVASRSAPDVSALVRVEDGMGRATITSARGLARNGSAAPWCLLSAHGAEALATAESAAPRLSDTLVPRMGVKTGANDLFIGAPCEDHERIEILRGRDIGPMRYSSTQTLAFAHDRSSGEVLPSPAVSRELKQWLEPAAQRLSLRADASETDAPWRLFRVHEDAVGHRVLWRDIAVRLDAAYAPPVADGGPVALNSAYSVAVPDAPSGLRLAAWLCSTPSRFVAAAYAERALSGYRRFRASNVGCVPVPPSVLQGDRALDGVAEALAHDPDDLGAWVALDTLAFSTLRLNADTILSICEEWNALSLGPNDRRDAIWKRYAP